MTSHARDPKLPSEPSAAEKISGEAPGVLVFVPTFNDNARASELAQEISAESPDYRSLVIDDGSATSVQSGAAGDTGLQVRLPDNFGLGTVTHIAFDHALSAGYSAVVRIDGDGQHRISDIPRLLEPIQDGTADLVVGTRTNHRARGSVLRSAAKIYFSFLARAITRGRAPSDINTGFFAANRTAMALLNQFTLERYPEPQLIVIACREGLRVRQVDIEQQERLQGRSTLGVVQAMRMFYRFNVFVINELIRGRRS
ncbi:MAG: glycosyltransferase family 2 protein [Alphaproteobacteria bacterium]|jgi:glycosyltransferase involved in cell wall biosynthesis|nr:glycosyltransferase family 2 protein [Alphaproteobacteria bacterium]MBT5860445.1 glycosyltransferase family 2 protein [Alphaproteobacteria bacterium]